MIWRLLIPVIILCMAQTTVAAGQVAIIIDDIGYNGPLGRRAADLPGAFTLAVLPFTAHSQELAQRAHRQGKEVMLHAPMSNTAHLPLGAGGLASGMEREDFLTSLRTSLANIPHLRGVNNHMGSQLTQEPEPMGWLMGELAQHKLYFIDSRTTAQSQALDVARAYHIPSLKRDVFLDNTRNIQVIQQQLLKAITLAKRQGYAVAIGHPYPETLTVLSRSKALFDQHHVRLVPVSQLLDAVFVMAPKRSQCLAPPVSLWFRPSVDYSQDVRNLHEGLGEFGYH